MNENQMAVAIEGYRIQETFFQKAARKLSIYIKRFIRRVIDICGAIVGLLIVIPLTVIVVIRNFKNKDYVVKELTENTFINELII